MNAIRAIRGEIVKPTPTMSVLLMMLPMMGSNPHKKVSTMITVP